MIENPELLQIATTASIEAGKVILKIYESEDFDAKLKKDNSPLTKADTRANTVIESYLKNTPYPIISEENKNEDFSARKNWEFCWIVDPLDGTKEFIKRNGEFTVNIALCKNGMPVLGVIYVPVTRELYYADVDKGQSFKSVLNEKHELTSPLFTSKDLIHPATKGSKKLRVVGSRSHMNQETLDFISEKEKSFESIEVVSKGSSLKFCLVAEGKADVYPRFAPTMEWDTAAGQAICAAVGLKVIAKDTGQNLVYNKENLLNPHFEVQ